MVNDNLSLKGALCIKLNDEVVKEIPNLVVTAGKNWVAGMLNDVGTKMGYMGVGTGTGNRS